MKVIVDCDTGNGEYYYWTCRHQIHRIQTLFLDDAWAIISLLKAEKKCDYEVIAITCVNGNTTVDHSSLNTLMILKTLGRLDVPVIIKLNVDLYHDCNTMYLRCTKGPNRV